MTLPVKKKKKEKKGATIKERGRKSMNFKVSKFKARIKNVKFKASMLKSYYSGKTSKASYMNLMHGKSSLKESL